MNTMALNFDTLQYAKKLQKAGFTEEQAEIQAETFKEQNDTINNWIDSNLVTKQDLKQALNILKQDLTIRLGSMIVAAVVTLGVLIPLMLKFLK